MFHIVLVEPEIPPNTGNVIRLAANTGCALHLVEPLGFSMEDRHMRRAGLDYHDYAQVLRYNDWSDFLTRAHPASNRLFALTTKGTTSVFEVRFEPGDWLVFGSETHGLPPRVRACIATQSHLLLPMRAQQRSLNLSNAVAVTVYEAWRQQGFANQASSH
jgi:tRNA (cytidine/uridine-2'-O-)-methyltransferase